VDFEWDPDKNDQNIARRGIDFTWAIEIFDGPVVEWIDQRKDYGEERWIAIGEVDGIILTIVYTWRDERRRIISAWKAHDRQRKRYRESFPEGEEGSSSE
jgi:uncharacterized DUF497 family protein